MEKLNTEKLQKVLARAGVASRRECEKLIAANRVSVDGNKVTLGTRVTGEEKIRVDGHLLTTNQEIKTKVIVYNKPEGEICSRNDTEDRETVFEKLPNLRNGRWISIGRLDINTSGLLLFTNDGELAHRLMHPSYEIERFYAVRVKGKVTPKMLETLKEGVQLEDGNASFDTITDEGGEGLNHWYHVSLKEGRNREVRRLWESQNVTVSRLMRIQFSNIHLPRDLRRGKWEYLDKADIKALMETVKL